ncbi:MAG: EscU/YscU/HrcU family type III secretion system export apparatus switch protein [Nitrospirae bacterium]|nr:EscU/YscU/HrcU family type III secretion system export apparatus switch protein [Nitrospirota bacterium]
MNEKNEKTRKAAALKYKPGPPGTPGAPRLIAKGTGTVADKIVEMAHANGIPITEDRQLIEILSALDLYQEIPYELYKAVAEVLAFVYSISKKP